MAVDSGLAVLSVWLAYYLRVGSFLPLWTSSNEHVLMNAWLIAIVISIPYFYVFRAVPRYFSVCWWFGYDVNHKSCQRIWDIICFSIVIIGIEGVPRTIGIIQPIVLFLLIASSRGVAPVAWRYV